MQQFYCNSLINVANQKFEIDSGFDRFGLELDLMNW